MIYVKAEGVRKRYGDVEALRGVSLEVHAAEIVALLGPNGAGKTTLVEILAGNRAYDEGHVEVLGHDPTGNRPEVRERVGIVPQSAFFEFQLTVREHVGLFRGYYRRALDVADVLDIVGLTAVADHRVGRLSGGQQRRLDMALALVGDPDLIFLDEPTTGFDIASRDQAWNVIRALRDLGKSVILTTHNMVEAERLSDRVLMLFGGRILASGRPGALLPGQHSRTIRFRVPASALAPLPAELDARLTLEGEVAVVHSENVTSDLHLLTSWALEHNAELDELELRGRELEDVYLQLSTQLHTRSMKGDNA
ncbi:MAG: ABC transporter ATP-binding protein [Dermatophilaceae bacterium]